MLAFSLLLILTWCGWVELSRYRQAQTEVAHAAQNAARLFALRIVGNLDQRFSELHSVALTLLGADFNAERVSAQVTLALHRYLDSHRHMRELVIRSADGRATWSSLGSGTARQGYAARFTVLATHVDDLVGYPESASKSGGHVLPLRYGVREAAGRLRYYVGTPFQLEALLLATHMALPWTLSIIDTRNGSVLGEVSHGHVSFPRKPAVSQGVMTSVPGYPFAIQADWAPGRVMDVYMQTAPVRWASELATILILAGVAAWLLVALRQRDKHARRLQHLVDFNVVRAQVNQAIGHAADEQGLLQSICDSAVRYGHLGLAWVGVPESDGGMRYLAASGATHYLDGILISTCPDIPEGRGPVGTTWRERRALFHASFEQTPMLEPWRERARKVDLRATATLPVFRSGSLWGVLAVYHPEVEFFDDDLKALLEELADDVSRGLSRLDISLREQALRDELAKARDYHRALFEHNAAGMCIVDDTQAFVDVNPVFCGYLGYTADELLGQGTGLLHNGDEEFLGFRPKTVAFSFVQQNRRFRRKDGSLLWLRVLGVPIELANGEQGTLWSCIDVTALHQARQEIVYQALHDVLTDLPNRRALEQHLPKAIARAQRTSTALAVAIIDLDDFKPVNEGMGHEVGDQLLKELGKRMLAELRQSDFLARLGGDEFVIVFEDLNEMYATQQLHVSMGRLHRVITRPFALGGEHSVEIGMSVGIAVYPFDAKDGGELLRQADAAMYRVKRYKHDRSEWWCLSAASSEQPERETVFEPYSAEASDLLRRVNEHLTNVSAQFVETFYSELAREEAPNAILRQLRSEEMGLLRQHQQEYMEFLLSPEVSCAMIEERARQLGCVHVLTGVSTALLAKAHTLYRRLLSERLNRALMPARDRYHIMLTVETRLQDDMQAELEMYDAVLGQYFRSVSSPLPPRGAVWADARNNEIGTLGDMPGVQCVVVLRPDARGVLAVEESAGPKAEVFSRILQDPHTEVVIDSDSPRGQGLSAQAWHTQQIMSSPSFAQDQRYAFWHGLVSELGLRSTLSIPIMSDAGHTVAVISLYGAYPNQFEAEWMKDFARSLQQRWAQIWSRCSAQAPPIPQDKALEWRQRLFTGGLRMFMQPIVDLRTGRMSKVEALARLELADGEILSPNMFLPLLGDVELDMLFRMGLDQVLSQLKRWDEQGLTLDISVNMSPVSLLDGECSQWVRQALQRHGIAAERLTLELLETQQIDSGERDVAISKLVELGVKLALDDLGSGHSSLERLASLPFNIIKVDQGLLTRIYQNPLQTLGLVRAIVQMGRDFDHEVVIEGLAEPALIEAVGILGAHYGQGYGLARPMPADEIQPWSKTFRLPPLGKEIRTFIGALAFHWQFIHDGSEHYPPRVEHCPLTRFLEEKGLVEGGAADWHGRVHEGVDVEDNSRRLSDWLVEQIKAEAASS